MQTRMEKYYDEETGIFLREARNEKLYENIGNYKVDDYKVEANATILDDDVRNIDVDHIKKILDNKYKMPQRRSIVIEEAEDKNEEINFDETREYDINVILEKAKSEKDVNYEKERVKKIRDTQLDILKSLNLDSADAKSEEENDVLEENVEKLKDTNNIEISKENEATDTKDFTFENDEIPRPTDNNELMELINTVTFHDEIIEEVNEEFENTTDPLDILTDLKGDDDTKVIGPKHFQEDLSESSPIMTLEEADEIKEEVIEDALNKIKENAELTSTIKFTDSDFEDFADLRKAVNSSKKLIIFIILFILVGAIVGGIILYKKFF